MTNKYDKGSYWVLKKFLKPILLITNKFMSVFGYVIVSKHKLVDTRLYEYESYEHYKKVQQFHNERKIDSVWADEETLKKIVKELNKNKKHNLKGLCHGARNGYEVNIFNQSKNIKCIGTDISETAKNYKNLFVWDYHKEKKAWLNKFDFVYTNSFDHAFKPKIAIQTWLNQINKTGQVIIEHTISHDPTGVSEMDPFGVKPKSFPYVIASWFGDQVSISIMKSKKSNVNLECWLFFITKNFHKIKHL